MAPHEPIRLKHEGRSLELVPRGCRVHMASEFAGNVDVDLRCDPALESILVDHLRLQVPGDARPVHVLATGPAQDGMEVGFHSLRVMHLEAPPEEVTLLFDDTVIATLKPVLTDAVPIERLHSLQSPAELDPKVTPPMTRNVCLGAPREGVWLMFTVALGLAGVGLGFAGWIIPDARWAAYAGLALLALAGFFGGHLYRLPPRQVWLDRDRRTVHILKGRTAAPEARLADTSGRPVSDFHHVRICHREYAPQLGDEHQRTTHVWIVGLEGRIPYGDEDGRVHSRRDAVELAALENDHAARRLAAHAALATGLPILEATDW